MNRKSIRLEKATKIIKSNRQPITTMPTNLVPKHHIYPVLENFRWCPLHSCCLHSEPHSHRAVAYDCCPHSGLCNDRNEVTSWVTGTELGPVCLVCDSWESRRHCQSVVWTRKQSAMRKKDNQAPASCSAPSLHLAPPGCCQPSAKHGWS